MAITHKAFVGALALAVLTLAACDDYEDEAWAEELLVADAEPGDILAPEVAIEPNEAPSIIAVEANFHTSCEHRRVCATAYDRDRDALEFSWEVKSHELWLIPSAWGQHEDGAVTECAEIGSATTGRFAVELAVYDITFDHLGEPIRREDTIGQDSHDRVKVTVDVQACEVELTPAHDPGPLPDHSPIIDPIDLSKDFPGDDPAVLCMCTPSS